MDEERKATSCEADLSFAGPSETEDLLNNSANISWSRIQKNLDDLNEQDMDEDDDDPPLVHIDLDSSVSDHAMMTTGWSDLS